MPFQPNGKLGKAAAVLFISFYWSLLIVIIAVLSLPPSPPLHTVGACLLVTCQAVLLSTASPKGTLSAWPGSLGAAPLPPGPLACPDHQGCWRRVCYWVPKLPSSLAFLISVPPPPHPPSSSFKNFISCLDCTLITHNARLLCACSWPFLPKRPLFLGVIKSGVIKSGCGKGRPLFL